MNNKQQSSITGTGFIAKNFIKYDDFFKKLRIKMYAAGVSNSLCKEIELFNKDKNNLINFKEKINEEETLLYFSTCSIEDPSRNKNLYVKHKLEIEHVIKENFKKYLIVRLPEVVGNNSNTNTLVNFFFNKIKNKEKFELWSKAQRSIIDIEDVAKVLVHFLSKKNFDNNLTINIANPKKSSALHIVKLFEEITKTKAKYDLVTKGEKNWEIDTSAVNDSMKDCEMDFKKNYLKNTLMKYFN